MSVSAKVRATTTAQTTDLNKLRLEVAESEKRAYGAKRVYGEFLTNTWAHFTKDWFAMDLSNATTDQAKAVKAERDALYIVLRAAGHTNPSVAWAQVKVQARLAKYGEPEKTKKGSSGAKAPARDSNTRCTEESAKLYAGVHNMTDSTAESIEFVNNMRADAKRLFGVDIDKSDK